MKIEEKKSFDNLLNKINKLEKDYIKIKNKKDRKSKIMKLTINYLKSQYNFLSLLDDVKKIKL